MSWDELNLTAEQELDYPDYVDPQELNRLYFKVFNSRDGQKVLNHLKAITVEQPSFIPGESASYGMDRDWET